MISELFPKSSAAPALIDRDDVVKTPLPGANVSAPPFKLSDATLKGELTVTLPLLITTLVELTGTASKFQLLAAFQAFDTCPVHVSEAAPTTPLIAGSKAKLPYPPDTN